MIDPELKEVIDRYKLCKNGNRGEYRDSDWDSDRGVMLIHTKHESDCIELAEEFLSMVDPDPMDADFLTKLGFEVVIDASKITFITFRKVAEYGYVFVVDFKYVTIDHHNYRCTLGEMTKGGLLCLLRALEDAKYI